MITNEKCSSYSVLLKSCFLVMLKLLHTYVCTWKLDASHVGAVSASLARAENGGITLCMAGHGGAAKRKSEEA